MAVKDHGYWVKYIPVSQLEGIPSGALCLKRKSDGQDWYEYVNVEEGNEHHKGRTKRFDKATVKCVVDVKSDPKGGAPDETIIRTSAVDERGCSRRMAN